MVDPATRSDNADVLGVHSGLPVERGKCGVNVALQLRILGGKRPILAIPAVVQCDRMNASRAQRRCQGKPTGAIHVALVKENHAWSGPAR